jgi:hypothetical protein
MAWTRSANVSKVLGFLETFQKRVHGVDISSKSGKSGAQPTRRNFSAGGFAESAKLEQAIKANLKGLGYGG